jgi:hypothetical protein
MLAALALEILEEINRGDSSDKLNKLSFDLEKVS